MSSYELDRPSQGTRARQALTRIFDDSKWGGEFAPADELQMLLQKMRSRADNGASTDEDTKNEFYHYYNEEKDSEFDVSYVTARVEQSRLTISTHKYKQKSNLLNDYIVVSETGERFPLGMSGTDPKQYVYRVNDEDEIVRTTYEDDQSMTVRVSVAEMARLEDFLGATYRVRFEKPRIV